MTTALCHFNGAAETRGEVRGQQQAAAYLLFHNFWCQIAIVVLFQQILSDTCQGVGTRLWQLTGQWYPADDEAFDETPTR